MTKPLETSSQDANHADEIADILEGHIEECDKAGETKGWSTAGVGGE